MDAEMVDMQLRKAHIRCSIQRVSAKDQFLKAMRSTPPDLTIIDGAFPRLDIPALMQVVLKTTPGVPWVVLSTTQAEDAVVKWMKAGASDVVTRKNYTRLGSVAAGLLAQPHAPHAAGPAPSVPGQAAPAHPAPAPSAPTHAAPSAATPPPASDSAASDPWGLGPSDALAFAHGLADSVPVAGTPSSGEGAGASPASPAPASPAPAAPELTSPEPTSPAPAAPELTSPEPTSPAPAAAAPAENEFFREIMEHAGDLVMVLDDQGVRMYSNPVHKEILDTPERLEGTVAFVDIHPEDRQRVAHAFRVAVAEGTEMRVEYRLMDKRGSVRVLESVGSSFASRTPGQKNAVVISRDVTERVERERAREALLQAIGPLTGEPFFQNLVFVIAETLMVRYVLVSEVMYQPYERVRSLAYWANGAFMPPFEYDLAGTTCEAVFATGGPVHYPDSVQELFPKEEALVDMGVRSYLGVPLVGTGGSLVGHIFLLDDKRLADPRRAMQMLLQVAPRTAMEVERFHKDQSGQAAESRLRLILESLADGVLTTDSQDIITYVNEQVVPFVGCSGVDIIGKPLTHLLEPWEGDQIPELPCDGEVRVKIRGGKGVLRPAVLQAKPLVDGTGRTTGTVFLVRPVAD
jgi:PAS domain S-box-containing protein